MKEKKEVIYKTFVHQWDDEKEKEFIKKGEEIRKENIKNSHGINVWKVYKNI